jgi:hypothetical protein
VSGYTANESTWRSRRLTTTSLVTEYRISRRVSEQFEAFMSGFNELIPQELINVFDERELEVGQHALRGFSLVSC